jgi:hypothetical protein
VRGGRAPRGPRKGAAALCTEGPDPGREVGAHWCYSRKVTDSQIDQLVSAARALPPAERIRVALRLLEGLPAEDRLRLAQEAGPVSAAPSMLGLFADEPELVDEVCRQAYADRERTQPRILDDDE